jgi:hypothetical protein
VQGEDLERLAYAAHLTGNTRHRAR